MRKLLLMPILLLISMSAMGCGMTPEMRQEMVREVAEHATAAVLEKTKEIAGDVAEKAVEVITEKATELGLSAEKAKELAEAAAEHAKETITLLIEEKVPAAITAVVEKVIPEATESSGTGKGVAGFLYMAFQGLLGLGKKGILGGVA